MPLLLRIVRLPLGVLLLSGSVVSMRRRNAGRRRAGGGGRCCRVGDGVDAERFVAIGSRLACGTVRGAERLRG